MIYIDNAMGHAREINERQTELFYENINGTEVTIPVAEGRSETALYIGLGQIKKTVKTLKDIDFPGRSMKEAAPNLAKKYNKIALIVNTGSGTTPAVKQVCEELSNYIEKTNSKQFTINALTSEPESYIGRCGTKFGTTIIVKGRDKSIKEESPTKNGIMNDPYELSTMLIVQKMKECINENKGYQSIFAKIDEETKIIKKNINDFTTSEPYKKILENMERRAKVIIGGIGPARNVAKMLAIRAQHVKRTMDSNAYLAGPFAPKPRPDDVLLLVSFSGETATILGWMKDHIKNGGNTYSIVGQKSPLSEQSQSFIIDAPSFIFDERAAFVLSPLPADLLLKQQKRGDTTSDQALRYATHTPFQ